jgi:hypothetical protein
MSWVLASWLMATAVRSASQVLLRSYPVPGDAFREVARIPCGQFQSAPSLVGVLYRLRGFERLLARALNEASNVFLGGETDAARADELRDSNRDALSDGSR